MMKNTERLEKPCSFRELNEIFFVGANDNKRVKETINLYSKNFIH